MSISSLAFTPGEPAGCGIDLAILLAQRNLNCELVCFSNKELLIARAKLLNLTIEIINFDFTSIPKPNLKNQIKLINFELQSSVTTQKPDPKNSNFVLTTIRHAAQLCLQKKFQALVTGPINKAVINQAGFEFSGHTEFLQEIAQVEKVVMMLANAKMKIALATTHLPLKEVAKNITKASLITTITILINDLQQKFNLKKPSILIAGLNPHAGECGYLGKEEITEITPALDYLKSNFVVDLIGPVPADTMFNPKLLNKADAILAMYHDQGLPVLKYSGFGESVNITLGLPFIRTSVDHGTALDLAGTGNISLGSLQEAIKTALTMIENEH